MTLHPSAHVANVHCSRCGRSCSGVDPELGLVVRAWVQCPECLEADLGLVMSLLMLLDMWKAVGRDGTCVAELQAELARFGGGS
jgi:hypothetical protein